ncbi:hypothetical protein ACJJTC_011839 [Scirpophaga incertulas]
MKNVNSDPKNQYNWYKETDENKIAALSKRKQIHRLILRNRTQRIVSKTGEINVEKWNKSESYIFPDIVTTFIEARWRWTLTYCLLSNVCLWLLFAILWWVILYYHGDLEEENIPHTVNNTGWVPCVTEIYGFTSIFLFTIEVQTTVGYGTRSPTLECPAAIFTLCMESIFGTLIQSFVIGIVFSKLNRPKNGEKNLLFSKMAVINQRDCNLCLIFRIGNTRKSRIISVCARAYLIRYITSSKGDILKNEQVELNLKVDDSDNDVFFKFPISAVHFINAHSPFFDMSANDLMNCDMEILVVFEGIIECTGQAVQAKSSYTASEILWGHRFRHMVDCPKNGKGYVIDFSKFDETERVDTPLCAAKGLKSFYKRVSKR